MGQPPAPQPPQQPVPPPMPAPPAAPPVAPAYAAAPAAPGKGMAIASMVLGLVAICFWCIPYLGIPCALVGVILGALAMKKINQAGGVGKGMAITGLVLSIVVLAIMVVLTIVAIAVFNSPEFQEQLRRAQQMQGG